MFSDYNEIILDNLTIEQPLKGGIANLDLEEILKVTRSLDDFKFDNNSDASKQPGGARVAGSTAIEGNEAAPSLITQGTNRMLANNIMINLKPAHDKPIQLSANRAKMVADNLLVQFEQNVKLEARQCRLSAPMALWSSKHKGIFLPGAYRVNGKNRHSPAFFQITRQGRCVKVRSAPSVEYVDMLDTVESKLFATMPASLRILFGFLGATAIAPP